ncbi:MAG: oligosaccharide flippase family protein [Lachnospiraceae bacterium]|jgi:O-antigen/teichoic acid export membrane protein|nr:oligosaccharide flippase family protein [Lachnospiraceae bacterium]
MGVNNNVKALKSGVWYTIANFITKSIGFITTPIFTRLLSHTDYGLYSNYASWLSTFTVFATFNLSSSFISARFDYEKDFDGYISSTLVLSSLVTALWSAVINLFPGFFSNVTGIKSRYINIMVMYLLLFSAVDMFQTRERYFYKYKISVTTSLLIAFSTALLSVFLVVNMENRLFGRILGSALPTVFVGIFLYPVLIYRGKKVETRYWRYALPICVPYIPHVLSLSLLNSMDKMMITRICGAEENALYSVAYSCGAVSTLLITSLNTAFSPWLGEKLNAKKYDEIRKVSKFYIIIFVYAACGIMLVTPEILLLMGGHSYSEAIYVMPPVAFGCICQFMYTMYVNVEQFSKKTIGMAIASILAALFNFLLNSFFISRVGYLAAAYTTLASFIILLFFHIFLVRRIGMQVVYSTRVIYLVLVLMSVYNILIHLLYLNRLIRYSVIGLYIMISIIIILKHKKELIKLIRNCQKQRQKR